MGLGPMGFQGPRQGPSVAPRSNALSQDYSQAALVTQTPHPIHDGPTGYTYGGPPGTSGPQGTGIGAETSGTGSAAGTVLPPGPTGIEGNPYIANFQKSLAASRGAIAAQMAAAMSEIGQNEKAGRADVSAFDANLGVMNQNAHSSLNALGKSADASMAAGGLKSYDSASSTLAPIGAAGDMATSFARGATPMLQQGVGAQAQVAKSNALQAGAQANLQLDSELRQFQMAESNRIAQENFQRQQQTAQYNHENRRDATQFGQQLTLAQLQNGGAGGSNDPTSGMNPFEKQHFETRQKVLDAKGTQYNVLEENAFRQSNQFTNFKKVSDPHQRAAMAIDYMRMHNNDDASTKFINFLAEEGVLPADFAPEKDYSDHSQGGVGDYLDFRYVTPGGGNRALKDISSRRLR